MAHSKISVLQAEWMSTFCTINWSIIIKTTHWLLFANLKQPSRSLVIITDMKYINGMLLFLRAICFRFSGRWASLWPTSEGSQIWVGGELHTSTHALGGFKPTTPVTAADDCEHLRLHGYYDQQWNISLIYITLFKHCD